MNTHTNSVSARFSTTPVPGLRLKHNHSLSRSSETGGSVPPKGVHPLAGRMALINLEARLAVWKSFQNKQVLEASESYRTALSRGLRVSPTRTGSLPMGLLNHWVSPDR